MKQRLILAYHTVVGILAAGELVTGYLSTLLGPVVGPKAAALMMLVSIALRAYEQAKSREGQS